MKLVIISVLLTVCFCRQWKSTSMERQRMQYDEGSLSGMSSGSSMQRMSGGQDQGIIENGKNISKGYNIIKGCII